MTGQRRLPAWVLAVTGLVYFFLHAPMLVLVLFSFNDSKFSTEWSGFTLHWYTRLLEREDILDALQRSLLVGGASTIVSTVLGTLLAMGLARHRLAARTVLEGLVYVPVVTPEIVCGISLLLLFVAMGIPLGTFTVILAHVAFNISYVTVVVRARLEGMDRSLEEAALILGADEWTTFWRVTVPQLWPGILSGALLAFTMSFDDFVITSLVSGPGTSTLPIVVYGMVRKNIEPSINAISTIVLVVTTVLIYVSDRLTRAPKPS
ncbi:MAG: ABC transporter permease [Pseudomonadota bacterium]|nr:ABC transporter permease [Pseudomonadota bacterium]